MAEIVDSVTRCESVPGTDRKAVAFIGEGGSYSFEFTAAAIEQLLPGLIAEPPVPGQDVAAATAISPVGCVPFESRQGLCGLAFNLGDKNLHIAVPRNGIEHVRTALDTIEAVYRQQQKPQ